MDRLTNERITEMFDSYKIIANLSMLAVAENDIEGVFALNEGLKRLYKPLSEQASEEDLHIIDTYNKLLALEYMKLKPEDSNTKLKIIKMCIDFDYNESIHSISLAQLFCEEGKYRESIMLAEYLTTVCDTAPPYLVLGKCYRNLEMYDMAIKAYRSYLILNENDKDAEKELNEIYEEMLGLEA